MMIKADTEYNGKNHNHQDNIQGGEVGPEVEASMVE